MKNNILGALSMTAVAALAGHAPSAMAEDVFIESLTNGEVYGDIRLRYEWVEQDNDLKDGNAFTNRTRLGFITGEISGFSGILEFEDSRVVAGVDSYNNLLGSKPDYSVIPDPQTTELDQGLIQYKSDAGDAKFGRQVITLDNQRFIGDVAWRQDRQTFDAVLLEASPGDGINLMYAYLTQRNFVLAEEFDQKSKDHLVNLSYDSSFGKITGYGYLLDSKVTNNTFDTYGLRFNGSTDAGDVALVYTAEYATQTFKSDAITTNFDADYMFFEGGIVVQGITAKLGYEVLGSDGGAYGFQTPLATGHKFNGWADIFLLTPVVGLEDLIVTVDAEVGDGKIMLVYHDFSADESNALVDDLGSEIDLLYATKIADNYEVGIKYAAYSAGDTNVDTDRFWLWTSVAF